jgi:hypothetical protein
VASRLAPDHFHYADHDAYTDGWATHFAGERGDPAGALVTKNLSGTQFMFVNTLMRHQPHAKMGHRLARSDFAARTVEKMTLLMRGVEGTEAAHALHPRMRELSDHSLKRTMRRSLRDSLMRDLASGRVSNGSHRSLMQEFVDDDARAHTLISVAGGVGADAGFEHRSVDVRTAAKLSRDCTLGDDKKSFAENCGLADALDGGASNPRCAGCSSCLGCRLRPPSCGGKGRDICHTDADCAEARFCDVVNCAHSVLTATPKNRHTRGDTGTGRDLCHAGPHWVGGQGAPGEAPGAGPERHRLAAMEVMAELDAFLWREGARCARCGDAPDPPLVPSQTSCEKACNGALHAPGGESQGALFAGGALDAPSVHNLLDNGTAASINDVAGLALLLQLPFRAELQVWARRECGTTCGAEPSTGGAAAAARRARSARAVAYEQVFDSLRRECDEEYCDASVTVLVGTERVPRAHHLAPVTRGLPKAGCEAAAELPDHCEGFTCSCMKQSETDYGKVSVLHSGDSCICGDFADQPADQHFELGFQSTWNYAIYNVVLCYMYMEAEHMCFPSIPYQIGSVPHFTWNVRSFLQRNSINYTCVNNHTVPQAGGAPVCADSNLQVHLSCPSFSALVYDDSALVHLLSDSFLPDIYIRQSVYNRLANTATALHFGFRYLFMTAGGGFAASFGAAWRVAARFALGGFVPFGEFATPDWWIVNLWTFPACDTVDDVAQKCVPPSTAPRAAQIVCPACCVPYGGAAGAPSAWPVFQNYNANMDCSQCRAQDFGAYWPRRSYLGSLLTFRDNYRRPMLPEVECVPAGETTPTASMTFCFFLQAGSVMWVSLMAIMLAGFAFSFQAPLAAGWDYAMGTARALASTVMPPLPRATHVRGPRVHAVDAHAALAAAGYTGEWSLAGVTRPLRRRSVALAKGTVNAVLLRPMRAFDAMVRGALDAETTGAGNV